MILFFYLDIDEVVEEKIMRTESETGFPTFVCTDCGYSSDRKHNIKRHVESKHVSCSFTCPVCQLPLSCRNSLKQHLAAKHNQHSNQWK